MANTSYKLRGFEPPDLRAYPSDVRTQFWTWVVEFGIREKVAEAEQGLNKDGNPLGPLKPKTRKYRRSAMTPSGKGDPNAQPLIPGHMKSRLISLLAGRAFSTHAEFYWRFDPFSGDEFGKILAIQRARGPNWDTIGLSPKGTIRVRNAAWKRWAAWKAGKYPAHPVVPRVADVLPIPQVGSYDMSHATFGIGVDDASKFAKGEWTGGMTAAEWAAYFRESAKASIPGRPNPATSPHPTTGPQFNRLLAHTWSPGGPGGQSAGAKAGGPRVGTGGTGKAKVATVAKAKVAKVAKVAMAPKPKATPKPVAPPPPPPLPPPKPRTFEEALATVDRGASSLDEVKARIARAIEDHAIAGPTGIFHGMSTPEAFRYVELWDIKWNFTGAPDQKSAIYTTLYEYWLMKIRWKVPDRLAESTKNVYFTHQKNDKDAYWAVQYNTPGFESAATGGDGSIVSYRGLPMPGPRFAHEAGHNLATALYYRTEPGGDYEQLLAKTKEPAVSAYARNSAAEDFAEAVRVYYENPAKMAIDFPERHKILHRLFTDPNYGG